MTRDVATCPFCGTVAGRLDLTRPQLVVEDRAGGAGPCPHAAFVSVSLDVFRGSARDRVPGRDGSWLWVRGEGLRAQKSGAADALTAYVDEAACALLPPDGYPTTPYRVGGGACRDRECSRPGDGVVRLAGGCGRPLVGVIDGWGLFSEAADTLVREVRGLAGWNP